VAAAAGGAEVGWAGGAAGVAGAQALMTIASAVSTTISLGTLIFISLSSLMANCVSDGYLLDTKFRVYPQIGTSSFVAT
jgi:hypothetical protein